MTENMELKRKRGGQPGNRNARKHGLYSRKLSPAQREQLKALIILNALEQAQALMRRRIAGYGRAPGQTAPAPGFDAMDAGQSMAPVNSSPGVNEAFEGFVLMQRSKLKGYVSLRLQMTMPVPELLTSEAKIMDLIRQIHFLPRTNNE